MKKNQGTKKPNKGVKKPDPQKNAQQYAYLCSVVTLIAVGATVAMIALAFAGNPLPITLFYILSTFGCLAFAVWIGLESVRAIALFIWLDLNEAARKAAIQAVESEGPTPL